MNEMRKYFAAPWGTLLKVISIGVTLLLLSVFGGLGLSGRSHSTLTTVLYLAFPLLVIFGSLLFTIRGYVLTGDTLLVRRLFWNTRIPLETVVSVTPDPKAMTGAVRTLGNGGLYGFSGKFRSGKLGSFRAYVTDFKKCVILETPTRKIVVSPEDPVGFAETVRATRREIP
ncbi:MAG: hypothetical protein GF388_00375 [Candidatus Aegiribacteria sp.]|nr:hypothetical protein [Candidatus Aegiribacteria sp.]